MIVLTQVRVFCRRSEQIRCKLRGAGLRMRPDVTTKRFFDKYLSPAPSVETKVMSISECPYHENRTVLDVVVIRFVARVLAHSSKRSKRV